MTSSSLLEDLLRCRYPVCKSIAPSGFGWDTSRLNEVIAAHTATLARPVDESDFYGIEDAIAQALRDCEGENPDTCSLSPKTLRRLRMALTAARGPCPTCDGSGEIIDRDDERIADPCPACVPDAIEKWCASCQEPRRRCVCPPWGSATSSAPSGCGGTGWVAESCPRGADKPEPTCTNRHQCWEPCGELGKSAEHAVAVPERPGLPPRKVASPLPVSAQAGETREGSKP